VEGGSIAREAVLGSALLRLIFPQRRSSPVVSYALAAGICVAAFLMRLAVDPLLQDHSPLVLFSLAVAASAIRGGFGPGIFATCLGAFLAVYFFPPQGKYFAIDPNYRSTAFFQLLVF
jgi:K+-sensing histidine kinase KdpD